MAGQSSDVLRRLFPAGIPTSGAGPRQIAKLSINRSFRDMRTTSLAGIGTGLLNRRCLRSAAGRLCGWRWTACVGKHVRPPLAQYCTPCLPSRLI